MRSPGDGVDHHEIAPPRGRIRGEHHTGRPRVDHLLHDDVHDGGGMPAVGLGALGTHRGGALAHGRGEAIDGIDAEHGVVLAGEGLVDAVFPDRRRPHGHRGRTGVGHLCEPGRRVVGGALCRGVRNDEPDGHGEPEAAQFREAGRLAAESVVGDVVEFDRSRCHGQLSASTISASASTAMGPG